MREFDKCGSEQGYSLVEALIALGVLAIATTGSVGVLRECVLQQARIQHRQAAFALVDRLLTFPPSQVGGEAPIGRDGPVADWTALRTHLETADLAGVPLRWERLDVVVHWQSQGQDYEVVGHRIVVVSANVDSP